MSPDSDKTASDKLGAIQFLLPCKLLMRQALLGLEVPLLWASPVV